MNYTMIELFPHRSDGEIHLLRAIAAEKRPVPSDRPWLMTNMIASADGATAVDGVSGPLGGPADQALFMALRATCDAILVGGQTVRAEQYRPPSGGSPEVRAARSGRGQAERQTVVVVSGSLNLDPGLPLFGDPTYRPLIATAARADAGKRAALAEVAEVVDAGDDHVDPARLLRELHRRALRLVLCEGGPTLNGQLVAADLVDEWNLTLSPILASGQAARPAHGPALLRPPTPMRLDRVWQADELLFCRWVRS